MKGDIGVFRSGNIVWISGCNIQIEIAKVLM